MKHLKSLLVLLMVCAMALPLLCACGDSSDASSQSAVSTGTGNTGNTSGDESENTDVAPEVIDLQGRTINSLCWAWGQNSASIKGFTGEIMYSDEENSSRVDKAKKEVVDYIEAAYNCTVNGEFCDNDIAGVLEKMVTTGTYDYDIVFVSANQAKNMLAKNLLTDLNTVPTLNFKNSWWDQNAVKDLSIRDRLFFVCGDINTYDNLGTWCVLFNKNLKTTLGIADDFYQKAKDGLWTMDYFMEVCKDVTQEYDGNTGIDEFDLWACGTETFNIYAHMVGGGLRIAEKGDDDVPYLTVTKSAETTYNALDKIITFYNSADVMVANGGKFDNKGYANVWEATINRAFTEGRELFYVCGLINVAGFRDMKDPFGILPMPMLYEGQDRYYHTVSPDNASFLALPYGVPGIEELGVVVEALAMKSQELVTPEFYDMQLKGRDSHDKESEDMLDIIFATRCFDIGISYNWGSIVGCYYSMDNSDIASSFDKVIDAAQLALEDTMEDLEDYEIVLN